MINTLKITRADYFRTGTLYGRPHEFLGRRRWWGSKCLHPQDHFLHSLSLCAVCLCMWHYKALGLELALLGTMRDAWEETCTALTGTPSDKTGSASGLWSRTAPLAMSAHSWGLSPAAHFLSSLSSSLFRLPPFFRSKNKEFLLVFCRGWDHFPLWSLDFNIFPILEPTPCLSQGISAKELFP